MAESNTGISIPFVADLSEVRKALDRLVEDARHKVVTIPFGGGGGGFGTPAGGGGGLPTVSGVFGSIPGGFGTNRASANFASAFPGAGGGGPPTVAGATPNWTWNWAQANNSNWAQANSFSWTGGTTNNTANVANSASFSNSAAAFSSFAFGGATSNVSNNNTYNYNGQRRSQQGGGGSFGGYGLGRAFGVGILAGDAFSLATAGRQYAISSTLAGSDQRGQLDATLAYREQVAGSFSFVSRAVAFADDPTGMNEAGVRATLGSADAGAARGNRMLSTGEATQRMREDAAAGSTANPYERRVREADNLHDQRMRHIKSERDAEAQANDVLVQKKKAELAADLDKDASTYFLSHAPKGGFDSMAEQNAARAKAEDAVRNRNDKSINSYQGELADGLKKKYDEQDSLNDSIHNSALRDLRLEELSRHGGALLGSANDIANANLRAANRPQEAERQAIVGETAEKILAAQGRRAPGIEIAALVAAGQAKLDAFDAGQSRQLRYDVEDYQGSSHATNAAINRDPLEARIRRIEADEQRALRDPRATEGSALRDEIQTDARSQRILARQQYQDNIELREMGLAGQGHVLDAALGGGRYSGIAGRAVGIRENAELEAARLDKEDHVHNGKAIETLLSNAQKEETLLARDFLRQFKPTNLDPALTAFGTNNDVSKTLDAIAVNTAEIAAAAKNGGIGGPPRAQ